ncbi:uncharacterized protein PV07_08236 [Cladophialophora immunda]|uniref:EthD domain-containing protein n=1 Tax=Cladophialophora immunda TaxID=569365 RepID=A0A0D2CBY5_9EURO|nr:uncharacterized protein PV07_08236 [Cladophialophora immunda]KIW28583.1 hypothetical protein PV07_08236 [Cladophialophora immunda]
MSYEEFHHYWTNVHGRMFLEMDVVRKHCLRYEQWQDDPEERKAVEDAFGMDHSGWDGLAVLTFDSIEGAKAVYHDPEFVKFATEDEPRFCKYPGVSKRVAVVGKPHIAWNKDDSVGYYGH